MPQPLRLSGSAVEVLLVTQPEIEVAAFVDGCHIGAGKGTECIQNGTDVCVVTTNCLEEIEDLIQPAMS
jgi:hypothetical protein